MIRACLGLWLLASCVAQSQVVVPEPSAPARAAFEAAYEAELLSDADLQVACLQRAAALAPEWLLVQRALDVALVAQLRGPEVWALRQAALTQAETPLNLYLLGRLEGAAGVARFERALQLDPQHAWSWHALGVRASEAGKAGAALDYSRRAFETARDPHERAAFGIVWAERRARAGEPLQADAALDKLCAELDSARLQRDVRVARAQLAIGQLGSPLHAQGLELACELLGTTALLPAQAESLTELVLAWCTDADEEARVDYALARAERVTVPAARAVLERALAARAADRGEWESALAWEESAAAREGVRLAGPEARLLRLRAGRITEAFAERVQDFAGMVAVESAVSALIEPARAAQAEPNAMNLARLAEACHAHGLHAEGEVIARRLRLLDEDLGQVWLQRALAGRATLASLRRMAKQLDTPARTGVADTTPRSIEAVLEHMAHACAVPLGQDPAQLAAQWKASEREEHLGFATVVEPLPHAGHADLAASARRWSRFVLVGDHAGSIGPDVAVLPLLVEAPIHGEHLGVAWSGTMSLCAAAEVPPRAARMGSAIAGAAVHKGYWLDLDQVRPQYEGWMNLWAKYPEADEVRALLAQPLPLCAPHEPTQFVPSLGGASRLLLTVWLERGGGETLSAPSFAETASLSMKHEEGHLVDRARLLPLGRDWLAAVRLLVRSGFSARALQEELELRAELVSWCTAVDPRIAVAKTLADAESGGNGTPHAAAYRRLVQELLTLLGTREDLSSVLDKRYPYCMQLQRLSAAELRDCAFALARKLN